MICIVYNMFLAGSTALKLYLLFFNKIIGKFWKLIYDLAQNFTWNSHDFESLSTFYVLIPQVPSGVMITRIPKMAVMNM